MPHDPRAPWENTPRPETADDRERKAIDTLKEFSRSIDELLSTLAYYKSEATPGQRREALNKVRLLAESGLLGDEKSAQLSNYIAEQTALLEGQA